MAYSVGGEVDTFCGKCKLDRTHKIVALDSDGSIARVMCATCESYHKFRAPKPARLLKSSDAKPKTRTARAGDKKAPVFDPIALMAMEARPYAMKSVYNVGDVIDHTAFGRGQVVNINNDKIEVHFGVGLKMLVHGRG